MKRKTCSNSNKIVFWKSSDQLYKTMTATFRSYGVIFDNFLLAIIFSTCRYDLWRNQNISYYLRSILNLELVWWPALGTHGTACDDSRDTMHLHVADTHAQWIQKTEADRQVPVSRNWPAASSPPRDRTYSGVISCRHKAFLAQAPSHKRGSQI